MGGDPRRCNNYSPRFSPRKRSCGRRVRRRDNDAMQPVIELAGLGVRFGKRDILKDLRISLSGRTIGLLGPNGAGKSTLIQSLLGFCPVSSGTASILGHDIRRHAREIRTLVGYMPENDSFIANMTAVAFVRMMGEI